MKQKHLVEIPEEVFTAVMITRHADGRIGIVTPKGDPNFMEVLTLTFGVFVSVIQGGEEEGINELAHLREYINTHSLEEAREKLVKMAILTRQMEAQDNE